MACCGQRIKKYKKVIAPMEKTLVGVYSEGADGFIKIAYNGDMTIKVNGCKTGNRYLFGKGSVRFVDYGDAQCLFDLMPGTFQEVVEAVRKTVKKVVPVVEDAVEDGIESGNTEDKDKSTES